MGENGALPQELESAMAKYKARILKEHSDKNVKVQTMMDYLISRNGENKPVNKDEIDVIIKWVKEMDQTKLPRSIAANELAIENKKTGVKRWASKSNSRAIGKSSSLLADR